MIFDNDTNKKPIGATFTIKNIRFRNSDAVIDEAILTKVDFKMLTNGTAPYFFTKFYLPAEQKNVYINPRAIASFEQE